MQTGTVHANAWGCKRECCTQLNPCRCAVHRLLRALEGKTVDFYSFARDTPKGKPMECHIVSAQAREVLLPGQPGSPGAQKLAALVTAEGEKH